LGRSLFAPEALDLDIESGYFVWMVWMVWAGRVLSIIVAALVVAGCSATPTVTVSQSDLKSR